MYQVKGYILSYIPYGDYDAVVHVYLQEEGLQSLFLKGLYSPKNKKKSVLRPLQAVDIIIKKPNTQTGLSLISSISATDDESEGQFNYAQASIRFFSSDFLNKVLRNEAYQTGIYNLIQRLDQQIKSGNSTAHFSAMLGLLHFLGISPQNENLPFLNPENGTYEAVRSHPLFDEEISQLWKMSLENSSFLQEIKNADRRKFLDSILVYYTYHVPGYRPGETLEIIRELF